MHTRTTDVAANRCSAMAGWMLCLELNMVSGVSLNTEATAVNSGLVRLAGRRHSLFESNTTSRW